jgi:HD-GYP domain-containing protein (c-di-GMP phosphodiesterase class II)
LGEGIIGQAVAELKMVHLPNLTSADSKFDRLSLAQNEGFVSYYAFPLIAKAQVKGVLEIFFRKPFTAPPEWVEFLDALAAQAAIAIDNASMYNELQRANVELELAYEKTLEGWARALEYRDVETKGHSERVTDMTLRIAMAMGVRPDQIDHIRRGALLHDIGKMGIPDSILFKPGKLTEEEWDIMRQHPVYAFEMLSPVPHLRPALNIPYYHHERWDGSGYPLGLKGDEIPLEARIFAVVDVWDALNSDRPYRKAWPKDDVLRYIQEQAGILFDPKVVEVFLKEVAWSP